MKTYGGKALINALEREGVDTVFGLPGGAILPVYDPLLESSMRHVLVRHEQGAGHMAQGYAQATGKPGVAMVTSGPAATNIVTPLADAYLDSVPMVAITGQVPFASIGTDAFQECDTTGITMAVTKHNFLVSKAEDIPQVIHDAFHLATTGRPGPVLVDIPKDIVDEGNPNSAMTDYVPDSHDLPGYHLDPEPDVTLLAEAADLITQDMALSAVVAGHGICLGSIKLAQHFIDTGALINPFPQSLTPGIKYSLLYDEDSPRLERINVFKQWLIKALSE